MKYVEYMKKGKAKCFENEIFINRLEHGMVTTMNPVMLSSTPNGEHLVTEESWTTFSLSNWLQLKALLLYTFF